MNYAAKEIVNQIERGPSEGENFFRVKVTGNGETRWVNVTEAQLRTFAMGIDQNAPVSAFHPAKA